MPIECIRAMVTGYTDYRDNDRILTLFSAERGRIDCKARNCRKPTAPLLACAQPFVYGEFELFVSNDRATVNGCEILETFYPLREDVDRFMTASAATQLCNSVIEHESSDRQLFSLLYHTLSFLSYTDTDAKDLLIAFMMHFIDHAGYRPSLTKCAVCRRDIRNDAVLFFSEGAGGVVCSGCASGAKQVSKLALEAMRRILLLSHEELSRVVLKDDLKRELSRILRNFCAKMLGETDRSIALLDQIL